MHDSDPVLGRVLAHVERTRDLRDNFGWPEPRTVEDLRNDPRVQLRNHRGATENLELATALMLMVAQDYAALAEAAAPDAQPSSPGPTHTEQESE